MDHTHGGRVGILLSQPRHHGTRPYCNHSWQGPTRRDSQIPIAGSLGSQDIQSSMRLEDGFHRVFDTEHGVRFFHRFFRALSILISDPLPIPRSPNPPRSIRAETLRPPLESSRETWSHRRVCPVHSPIVPVGIAKEKSLTARQPATCIPVLGLQRSFRFPLPQLQRATRTKSNGKKNESTMGFAWRSKIKRGKCTQALTHSINEVEGMKNESEADERN